MPAHRLPFPSLKDVLAQAPSYTSLTKLSRRPWPENGDKGYRPSSFIERLRNEGWKQQVEGVLGNATVQVEPTEEVSEVEVLRERVRELEKAARRVRKLDVRDELILQRFDSALGEIEPAKTKAPPRRKTVGDAAQEDLVLLSDTHANEVVSLEETLGVNVYDWAIMEDRLARVQAAALSHHAHTLNPARKLRVPMLGDMVTGTIHDELRETNEMPHEHSVVRLGYTLSRWLEGFLDDYEEIEVTGVIGNHPRRHKKPQMKNATDNSDWTLYKFIECYHRNHPRIKVVVPNARYADMVVCDRWRFLLMHGDGGARSTMVGVPWGKIVRHLQQLEQQFQQAGKPVDYVLAGHFHTRNDVEGISTRLYMNGSVKGVDEYSIHRFGAGSRPEQLMLTVHPQRGVIGTRYLDAQDVHPNAEAVERRLRAA